MSETGVLSNEVEVVEATKRIKRKTNKEAVLAERAKVKLIM